jgi:hypothetical protein
LLYEGKAAGAIFPERSATQGTFGKQRRGGIVLFRDLPTFSANHGAFCRLPPLLLLLLLLIMTMMVAVPVMLWRAYHPRCRSFFLTTPCMSCPLTPQSISLKVAPSMCRYALHTPTKQRIIGRRQKLRLVQGKFVMGKLHGSFMRCPGDLCTHSTLPSGRSRPAPRISPCPRGSN